MDRKDVFEYVKKQYGTVPEYLWKESPESAVLRHKNGKWYAVLMQVKKSKLELEGEGTVDIINVKCEPDMVGVLIETYGFLPGYHMNKEHWITMLMDGTVSEAKFPDFEVLFYSGTEEELLKAFLANRLDLLFLPEKSAVKMDDDYCSKEIELSCVSTIMSDAGLTVEFVGEKKNKLKSFWKQDHKKQVIVEFLKCLDEISHYV